MKKLLISLMAIALMALTASLIMAQTVSLQQQADITTGAANNSPRMAVGDVNNDTLPDLVVLNKGNTTANGPISVFLNNGAGGFNAPINITDSTNLSPNAVVIRDLDRDGNADLAIAADGLSSGINIRLGNGTGNFPTGTYIAERGSPAISAADFNSDGRWDLAICNNTNELRVLNGDGAGGFGAAATYTTGNACTDLLTADFNADGRADIVTAARLATSSIQVFLNNGSGIFNAPVNTVANGAYTLVTADFNRDCFPDLASVQYTGTTIYVLLGNGAGGFTSSTVTVNNSPARMTVGDFNRDKKVDLAVRRNSLTAGANNLTILPGNGSGGFGAAFEMSVAVPTNTVEMYIATIDVNRDGKQDLLVGRQGGFLHFQNTSPLFTRTENDFDGDLRTDLSVFRPSGGDWYLQRSTQGFFAQHWGASTDKPAPGDYDGDGKTDIAVWRPATFANFYIFNSSNSTVRAEQFGQTGDTLMVADWDGDGLADPAIYRGGSQSYFYYRGSLNNPNGNITFVPWGTTGDTGVRGDFDGDGRADAAVFRPSDGIWYILQSANGQPRYTQWGLSSDRPAAADYDGDNRSDVTVFRPSNGVWYILNSTNGGLSAVQWGNSTDMLVPGDYNGDGRTEPAVYRSPDTWYASPCAGSTVSGARFGSVGDTPVPSSYLP